MPQDHCLRSARAYFALRAPLISVEALNTKDFSELILVGLLQRVGGSVGLDVTTR